MSKVTSKLLSRYRSKGDKDEASNADLEEEIEKVFAMSENEKFDLSRFNSEGENQPATEQGRYNEKEFSDSHRKRTYPHIHLPIKGLRSSKRKSSTNIKTAKYKNEANSSGNPRISENFEIKGEVESIKIGSLCEDPQSQPLISERAVFSSRESTSPDRRVQFKMDTVDSENGVEETEKNTTEYKMKRKHSGHHHKRSRKHGSRDEDKHEYKLIIKLEEPLEELVQDDMTSHRFNHSRDKRRFSTKAPISSVLSKKSNEISSVISEIPLIYNKSFDHSPHEVFVQLDELTGVGEEREWKETARWIKYEEDVEEGADRWGRPHVASLSFHSLLNLRRCLETGVVLLDLDEKELPGIAYRVVEQMVIDQVIKEEEKATIIRALLLRHRHVNEHDRFPFIRRNTASYTSLQGMLDEQNGSAAIGSNDNLHEDAKKIPVKSISNNYDDKKDFVMEMKEETYSSSSEDLYRKTQREKVLKRIPTDAEATTVFVGTVDFLEEPAIAFVRLAQGIFLPAVTEVTIPVRFMFILLGPQKAGVDYHEIGRSISTLMSYSDFNKKAYKGTNRRELLSAINEFLDYSIVLPPGNWESEALLSLRELHAKNEAIRMGRFQEETPADKVQLVLDDEKKDDDPLRRTKKPFGGMINDIKRRFPFYMSDFRDGLNGQCVSAAIFMYFAALSAAITFGGLSAGKTENMIGISETLMATSFAGILFSLFAGQPLIIIGTTGPLLLFDESLFKFCQSNDIEYMTMRLYIGIWLVVIALLVASIEGSVFIKVFTRFTEEIFSSLISLLYIYESISNLITLFYKHPLLSLSEYFKLNNLTDFNETLPAITSSSTVKNQPNTALFCLILSLGTFFLAYYLRYFKKTKFLGRSARRGLGDFGVPIAIITMGALAAVAPNTYIEKLSVPEGLSPSLGNRSWIVSPLGETNIFPVWAMFAALIPALLVYILVFMETHISELLIGKKERKLKKGNGFHLDIVLVCLSNAGCGLMGAPWMCAATVRSLTHVSSVTVMSTTHAPGEKPHIVEVREQRVSSLIVSVLVGISVLMAPVLRFVPMAVLFGVFLYMGISSIDGVQFFKRLKLFFVPVKHHPERNYVRRVPTFKMHLFTLIQLSCLIILWIIKSSAISLTFPFCLILMVPLRAQLSCIFKPNELRALDSDAPNDSDTDDDEPDFFAESVLPG